MDSIADIPVALLAGGLATRLAPITRTIPKALVEIAGRPFIDYQLDLLYKNGIRQVVLCLGHLGNMVRDYLGDGQTRGMRIGYSFDGDKLLGTGGAIQRALPMLGSTFWIMYGDSYMDIDYREVLERFQQSTALGLMTVLRNGNRWDKSNVVFRNGRLIRYDKHHSTPDMDYIDYGVALLRRQAAATIPAGQPFDLADLYHRLVNEGQMIGFEVHSRFYEIGTPASLEEARKYLASVSSPAQPTNSNVPR